MTPFLKKHSTLILTSLLVTLLALAWLFPSAGLKLGIAFLLLCFLLVSWLALDKQKNAYRQGQLTRSRFIRNAVIEISGVWVVMTLAGLLGRGAAGFATQPIRDGSLRVVAGIVIGLLVGIGLGALAQRTLRRLAGISSKG